MIVTAPLCLINAFLCFALGYLFGSVPFGLLITRLSGHGDVRKIGSGNIGATNVLRTGARWAAVLTLLCDAGKGALAVLIARHFFGANGALVAGLAAVLGHIFPVWLKFQGGKGVASSLGVMLAVCPPAGVAMLATWLAIAYLSKISSLSALITVLLAPAYAILFGRLTAAALALVIAIIIIATHHENIRRLFRGCEPHIGRRDTDTPSA